MGIRAQRFIIGLLLVALMLFSGFLYLVAKDAGDSTAYAMVRMAWCLIIVWVVLGGGAMYLFRNRVRAFLRAVSFPWQVTFVLSATALALLEEVVTVTLTNLAPAFGVRVGQAFITASTNYFDVVLFHSVIVFIPMFIAWSLLLTRYDFKPFAVFFLFGAMGIVGEATIVGPASALAGAVMWIFVYGLMVYLPAYAIPENRGARSVGVIHHLFAVPVAFVLSAPLLIPIVFVITQVLGHPSMHF